MTLSKAEEYMQFWNVLMPTGQTTDLRQFAFWVASYSDAAIKRGMKRAANKYFKNPDMTTSRLLSYANSVMYHVEQEMEMEMGNEKAGYAI